MNKLLFLASLLSLSFLTSCRKTGCTDDDSISFNKDIKTDNSLCKYEGSLVFWYNKEVADFLSENNVEELNFYINDEIFGNMSSRAFRNSDPDCNDYKNAVKTTKNLGEQKAVEYEISIQSTDSIEIWRTFITINANTCSTLQLGL